MNKSSCILLLFILLAIFSINISKAQDMDPVLRLNRINEPSYIFDDYTFKPNIKTVMIYREGFENSYPIINLYTDDQLEFTFDDLEPTPKTYSFSFIHCNSDWTASGMFSTDYIDGFNEYSLNEYEYSTNTTFRYIHYKVELPNFEIKFKLSGNYILKVYQDYNRDSVILTRRFMVVEPLVQVNTWVHQATLVDLKKCCQEVDFIMNYNDYPVVDPFNDFKVVIGQNWRSDNYISNLKPRFVKDRELSYDYDEENVFGGGSEFRNFDTRNLKFLSEHVYEVSYLDSLYHVALYCDESRSYKRYSFEQEFNGKYIIAAQNRDNPQIDADYVNVYFTLKSPVEILNTEVYVFGALSDWNFSPMNRMVYNPAHQMYELRMLLKQGYYNYEYVTLDKGTRHGSMNDFEGSHFETENDYFVFVYHRDRSFNYDRLVAIGQVNTVIK